jgi:hypothetical protein
VLGARREFAVPVGVRAPDGFRENRGITEGTYVHTALAVEARPDVAAEFVRPGVNARLLYERADGGMFAPGLTYQRAELRLVGRWTTDLPWRGGLAGSSLVLVGRGDAGALWGGTPPPQQLFELGQNQNLPGYGYKEFAGDRAAVLRGFALVQSPWQRAPLRLRVLGRPIVLPGLSPGVSAGVQGGVAEASNVAARQSILRLGTVLDTRTGVERAVSRPTDGVRATVNAGLRFFGGAVFAGAARPVDRQTDRRGGWRLVLSLDQRL